MGCTSPSPHIHRDSDTLRALSEWVYVGEGHEFDFSKECYTSSRAVQNRWLLKQSQNSKLWCTERTQHTVNSTCTDEPSTAHCSHSLQYTYTVHSTQCRAPITRTKYNSRGPEIRLDFIYFFVRNLFVVDLTIYIVSPGSHRVYSPYRFDNRVTLSATTTANGRQKRYFEASGFCSRRMKGHSCFAALAQRGIFRIMVVLRETSASSNMSDLFTHISNIGG